MLVGQRIRDLRLERGLSQEDLGSLLGVTKVSICGYENSTRTPSLSTFLLIAEEFGVSTDYLLGREVKIRNEENCILANVSCSDIEIISEIKKYPNLYEKAIKSPSRYINLINKKMK